MNEWTQEWPEGLTGGQPDSNSTRVRFTDSDIASVVAAAARSGRIPRARMGYWQARVARGGREGGQAIATLLQLHAAGGPMDEDLYAEVYPTREQYERWVEEETARQSADAVKFRKANDYSNTLRVSAAAAAAMSDDEIYRRLFPS